MIKRTTTIVFILLASILLLAHAVVPHHHHNKLVCLVESHCSGDNNSTGQSTDKESHNHDGEENSNDCILKELIAVPSNEWKQGFKLIVIDNYHYGHDAFQAFCFST